uniref:Putative secreted protein n=1 Tax=Ixodes ricinus TaxID=34613 RepID=A0A147BLE9_IXORI
MFRKQLACILSLLPKVTVSWTAQANAPTAASRRACTLGPPPTDRRLAWLAARYSPSLGRGPGRCARSVETA